MTSGWLLVYVPYLILLITPVALLILSVVTTTRREEGSLGMGAFMMLMAGIGGLGVLVGGSLTSAMIANGDWRLQFMLVGVGALLVFFVLAASERDWAAGVAAVLTLLYAGALFALQWAVADVPADLSGRGHALGAVTLTALLVPGAYCVWALFYRMREKRGMLLAAAAVALLLGCSVFWLSLPLAVRLQALVR